MKARTIALNPSPTATDPQSAAASCRPALPALATLAATSLLGAALVVGLTGGVAAAARDAVMGGTCWLLVAGGVTGTFLAGTGRRLGWLILLGMQPLWIAYAIVTGQYGFVPGSLAYAAAQFNGYLRVANGGV